MDIVGMTLLVIEDNADERCLFESAFNTVAPEWSLQFAGSVAEALAYLNREGPFRDRSKFPAPKLIVTDLQLPAENAFSFLEKRLECHAWRRIPTVVWSSSSAPEDVLKSYDLGAVSYLVKPVSFTELRMQIKALCDFWQVSQVPDPDGTSRISRASVTR
jgi:CheY-like chemotaxis protein